MPDALPGPVRPPELNSFQVLHALRRIIPDSLVHTGKTGLPLMVIKQTTVRGSQVGPIKVFYNLVPKQFRVLDESNPKYEFRCGTPGEVLEEIEGLYDKELPDVPAMIAHLR
jgi:hypothetical protein